MKQTFQKIEVQPINPYSEIKTKLSQLAIIKNGIYCFNNTSDKNRLFIYENINLQVDRKFQQSPVGLRILDVQKNDIGIQFGCEMFSFVLYLEKICGLMIVIDSYKRLLNFNKGLTAAQKKKIILISGISIDDTVLNNIFDFAIISSSINTRIKKKDHLELLRLANNLLKYKGKLYFAVDNIYNYNNFISKVLSLDNINLSLHLKSYKNLLHLARYEDLIEYAVFPDNKFPLRIYPMSRINQINYETVSSNLYVESLLSKIIRKMRIYLDTILFDKMGLFNHSPSFIFIAKRN